MNIMKFVKWWGKTNSLKLILILKWFEKKLKKTHEPEYKVWKKLMFNNNGKISG